MPGIADHYAALELKPSASDAEIKRRYRALMRTVHPDANGGDPEATRKAARVNSAFEVLGHPERRRAYDRDLARRDGRLYAHWAVQPDWEDIVAAQVPPRRPPHVHVSSPRIDPEEIEVSVAELETQARVRRTITLTNRCACTMHGDISTSEPWLRGPVGRISAGPDETVAFEVEVIAGKVQFPGVSRVTIVTQHSTHVVPVNVAGFRTRARRRPYDTDAQYVPRGSNRTKWAKYRR